MNKKSRQGLFQKFPGTALGIWISDEGLFAKMSFIRKRPLQDPCWAASGFALGDLDHSADVGRRQDLC